MQQKRAKKKLPSACRQRICNTNEQLTEQIARVEYKERCHIQGFFIWTSEHCFLTCVCCAAIERTIPLTHKRDASSFYQAQNALRLGLITKVMSKPDALPIQVATCTHLFEPAASHQTLSACASRSVPLCALEIEECLRHRTSKDVQLFFKANNENR